MFKGIDENSQELTQTAVDLIRLAIKTVCLIQTTNPQGANTIHNVHKALIKCEKNLINLVDAETKEEKKEK